MVAPTAKQQFSTRSITDPEERAVAEMVDARVGSRFVRGYSRRGDFVVTARDLEGAQKALARQREAEARERGARGPLGDMSRRERDLFERHLPKLKKYLGGDPPKRPPRVIESLPAEAIAPEEARRCALLIGRYFGEAKNKEDRQVHWGELGEARVAYEKLVNGELEREDPRLAGILKRAPYFRPEVIDCLALFMETGQGGLLNHGPMRVGDRIFEEVVRVPLPRTASGEPSTAVRSLNKAVETMEGLLERSEFDRVYVRGADLHLYLGLTRPSVVWKNSSIRDVREGFRALLPDEAGGFRDAGTVVKVVDVNNSLWEATFGFWGSVLGKSAELFWEKMAVSLDKAIAKVVKEATTLPDPKKAVATGISTLQLLSAAGVGAAGFGGAMVNLPATAGVVGIAAAALTTSNVVDCMTRTDDKAALYHGIGVGLARRSHR